MPTPPQELAKALEASLLRPTARRADVEELCEEASREHYAAVVVLPVWVSTAAALLRDSDVRVVAAIAYPFGAETPRTKVAAVEQAVRDGADELELVAALAALVAGEHDAARAELTAVVRAASRLGAPGGRVPLTRAVIETCYLDAEGKRRAAQAAEQAGCDAVVTSTGLGPDGATEADVSLLRSALSSAVAVKAAGGVRSLHDAEAMLVAGAARLGTQHAGEILDEARSAPRRAR